MAKKSSVIKNEKRKVLAKKYVAYRKKLREEAADLSGTDETRWEAQVKLQKLRRNTSALRVRSRCYLTGRPRGNYRKFGLSRLSFRQLALSGKLPGVTKASW